MYDKLGAIQNIMLTDLKYLRQHHKIVLVILASIVKSDFHKLDVGL